MISNSGITSFLFERGPGRTPSTRLRGIFASTAAADATMAQVRGPGSPLRKVDASNVLELARDETGRVTAGIIDPGSTSGVDVPALAGIAANDPTEAVLLINTTDDRGDPLTGAYRYEMTFPGDMEPPVDALGR